MSTISRNSFSLAHMRAWGVRQIALLLIVASALLVALYLAATLPVAGAGVLTITSNTGPNAVFDSNKPVEQSPSVFMAEAKVCNTGDATLTDVYVYIGDGSTVGEFPDTNVGGTPYELMLLDEVVNGDVSDGTRYFTSLAAGDCVGVFWQVDYPTGVAALNGNSFGFTIWGNANAGGMTVTDSEPDSITTRSTISASANRINPLNRTVTPAGPYDIGEQLEICYTNVEFGIIGSGQSGANDFWFQPVGDTAFDPDSLTLVSTEATLYTNKCTNDPYIFTDITYFGQIEGGTPPGDWDNDGVVECSSNSQSVTGQYCYTFVAIGNGDSVLNPYQQASSGNQQKFNGDYGTNTISVGVNNSCSLSLVKSADKSDVQIGDELTYTLDYENLLTDNAVGYPPTAPIFIDDAIPTGTTYQPNSATCSASCTILYSVDGMNYSSTPPVDQTTVTDLRFILSDALAASGTGTVDYIVDVNTNDGITAAGASTNLGGGDTCTESLPVTTTPVTLAYASAERSGKSTTFAWQTATEAGTVGYNLYGIATDGSLVQLNDGLIPATGIATVQPQNYNLTVPTWSGDSYIIEDIGARGEIGRHGPFQVGQPVGRLLTAAPINWDTIRAEQAAYEAQQQAASRSAARATFASTTPSAETNLRATANGTIEIRVNRDGIQRITYQDLVNFGINPLGLRANKLAVTYNGEPVPLAISGGPTIGPDTVIEFIGYARAGLYSDTNIYALTLDRSAAARVDIDNRPVPNGTPVAGYLEIVRVEEDNEYLFLAPNGDPWADTLMMAYGNSFSQDKTITVSNYLAGAGDVTLTVDIWGLTDWPVADDHRLQVAVNGVTVADESYDGLTDHPLTIVLPDGVLVEGDNIVTLTVPQPSDPAIQWDMQYLNAIEVSYPRAFIATNDLLTFTAAGDVFAVSGLSSDAVVVYRESVDGSVTRLRRLNVSADGAGGYTARFRGHAEAATYYIAAGDAVPTAVLQAGQPYHDITSGSADYLMVSHGSFVDSLAPLVQFHQNNGLSVKVVDVADIYAQFGYGHFEPQAIRDYIAHAITHMGVQYVLLVGGDTYDYFDNLGLGSISFVPSLYGPTEPYVTFAPLDPLYVDVDGDGVPDAPIGRFPVRTSAELDNVIAKTLAYAGQSDQSILLAADDGFRSASASFEALVPSGWQVTTAYLDDGDVAAARQTVLDTLNGTVRLTSFLGHSGPTTWTFDGLFNATDAANLTNTTPTVVTQWGCWNTYHVDPAYNTLAHTFMLNEGGGAAAVLGAATLTQASSDSLLGMRILPQITMPGQSLGTGIQAAKDDLALTHADLADVLLGWTLLGDPALVVESPAP